MTRQGTHWLLVGALLGGAGAYLFQLVGTRVLGEEAYAPIGSLWTIQYLVWSTLLFAVETYVTREVVLGRIGPTFPRPAAMRTIAWIGGFAAVLTVGAWLVHDRLFYGLGDLALVAGLTVLSFGAFAVVRGRLAGAGRFKAYGLVSASESLIRLALAVGVVVVGATTRGFAWVLPIGAAAAACWWFVLGRRRSTPHVEPRPAVEPPRTGRFLMLNTTANGAAQLLLAGGVLAMTALSAPAADLSVFFVTITAARVPVVLALGGVLSRLLPAFRRALDDRGEHALPGLAARLAVGATLVAAIGTATGAAVGGPLIGALFGAGFAPPWWLAAAAAGGVLLATGGLLLNQLLVAGGLEQRLPLPWFAGLTAAAVVVVLVRGSPTVRVTAGFLVGEVVALVSLIVASRRPRRIPTGTVP
jgi:O-antigen/teichoic acid export membrane protein